MVPPGGSSYKPPESTPTPTPTPTPPSGGGTGRNEDRDGSKGTNTSFKGYELDLNIANSALNRLGVPGMADVNSFLSEQLPVAPSQKNVVGYIDRNGNEVRPEGEDLELLQKRAGVFKDDPAFGGNSETEYIYEGISKPGEDELTPTETADNTRSLTIDSGARGSQSSRGGIRVNGAVDDRFAEGAEYGETYETTYSPLRKAQREAFLSDKYDSSVVASRASDSAIGRGTFGGKRYFNDGGELREVTEDAYKKYGYGKLSADELKNAWVTSIVEDGEKPALPAGQKDITNMTKTNTKLGEILDEVGSAPGKDPGVYQTKAQDVEFEMNNAVPADVSVADSRTAAMKTNYFNTDDDDED